MLIRLLIYAIIFGAIYYGLRRIIADWRGKFQDMDQQKRKSDLRERQRPDVVELEQDEDGVYRPLSGNESDKTDKNNRK